MYEWIQEDETIEDLQLNGLKLIQKKNAFRFGMDSVLLAHFASVRENDSVVDLGSGNGILPLLLIGRNKGSCFHTFEIQEEAAKLAARNIRLNHLEDRVSIIHDDVMNLPAYLSSCSVDAAVCNPPYGHPSASLESSNPRIKTARSQQQDTLDKFFSAAFHALKGRGKLSLVYPAPQMLHVMNLLHNHHLEPKRFQLVYPFMDKPANLVLIEAVKDARPTLHPMPPLIVYQEDGDLTKVLKSIYHM